MFATWREFEPRISAQRRTQMVVEDKYVTWFDGTYSSAVIDLNTMQSYPMGPLWLTESGPVMSVVASSASDLSKFAGLGQTEDLQTIHFRGADSSGQPKTTIKKCSEITGVGMLR